MNGATTNRYQIPCNDAVELWFELIKVLLFFVWSYFQTFFLFVNRIFGLILPLLSFSYIRLNEVTVRKKMREKKPTASFHSIALSLSTFSFSRKSFYTSCQGISAELCIGVTFKFLKDSIFSLKVLFKNLKISKKVNPLKCSMFLSPKKRRRKKVRKRK